MATSSIRELEELESIWGCIKEAFYELCRAFGLAADNLESLAELAVCLYPQPSTPKSYGLSLLQNRSFDKNQLRRYGYLPIPNKKLPYYRRNY